MPRLCVEARGSKRQPHTVIYFVRLAKSDPPVQAVRRAVVQTALHLDMTVEMRSTLYKRASI